MASKAIQGAKARVAALEAVIAEAVIAEKAAAAAVAPAQKKRVALETRQAKALALTSAGGAPYSEGGAISLISLATIKLGYRDARRSAKQLIEALVKGEQKVEARGGVSYTLRGLVQRTRITDKVRLRPVQRAVKARERAQKALHRAWQNEREAYQAAFDNGDKPELEAVAKAIAAREALVVTPERNSELNQRRHDAEYRLPEARQHLDWLKASNPDKDVCPCGQCARERQEAIRLRDRKAKLAELPKVRRECPTHGKRLMPTERVDIYRDGRWLVTPVVYCPVDLERYIDAVQVAHEAAHPPRKAKAAA